MAKEKKELEIKKPKYRISKVVTGIGETKNIGNFESIKVYNELEATLEEGTKVAEVQEELRAAVIKLNERDFNHILKQ